ncbi:MAG: helix-turn-helix domain-containing protein [Magnetospirillum sp.]|nr:helix-turn-helix domain-containing protein [Magnetospirillum sp.]
MDVREQFGRLLREARMTKGLTQEELAFRAGMSVPYLSEVERGRPSPSLTMMVDLAIALEIHLADLVRPMTMERAQHDGGRKRPQDEGTNG